eukprot:TRINITY_DN8948_c0_g1_i1.p1 TRINITY_DN8948_c0_g1~~TRINITY_DN8948_c0_g1_i1.p1  ORF type:complete len:124 (-),score=22.91 TRINITY_DN8948_c0_g1_i1:30-401(-)
MSFAVNLSSFLSRSPLTLSSSLSKQIRTKQGGPTLFRKNKYKGKGNWSSAKKRFRVMGSGNVKCFPKKIGGFKKLWRVHGKRQAPGNAQHLRILLKGFKRDPNPLSRKMYHYQNLTENPFLKD